LKKDTWKKILGGVDRVLTFPDTLIFVYYGVQRNSVKETKKVEIKISKGIKKGTKLPDFNSLLRHTLTEIEDYNRLVPFWLRLVPTLILGLVVFFIVV